MLKRLVLAAVLAFLPTLGLAQATAPNASVCDGSEVRHTRQLRATGHALFSATALVDLAAVLTIPRNPGGAEKASSHFRVVAVTAPVALAGLFIAGRASPGEGFWQDVVARLKVGETKSADVRLCLQRPQVKTSNGSEERWTYVMTRPAVLDAPRYRSLRLTFRDSLLTEVLTKEVSASAKTRHPDSIGQGPDRHHGFCAPPVTAIPDPFPTPTDTTFAAAAMARAQADAEAASKNAAAFAAYAACMASDTAR